MSETPFSNQQKRRASEEAAAIEAYKIKHPGRSDAEIRKLRRIAAGKPVTADAIAVLEARVRRLEALLSDNKR